MKRFSSFVGAIAIALCGSGVRAVLVDRINEDIRNTQVDINDVRLLIDNLNFSMESPRGTIQRQNERLPTGNTITSLHRDEIQVEVVPDILSVLKTEQEKADTLQMEQERNLQKIMEQNTMQRSSVHSTIEEAIKRLEPPVGGIRRGRSLLLQ